MISTVLQDSARLGAQSRRKDSRKSRRGAPTKFTDSPTQNTLEGSGGLGTTSSRQFMPKFSQTVAHLTRFLPSKSSSQGGPIGGPPSQRGASLVASPQPPSKSSVRSFVTRAVWPTLTRFTSQHVKKEVLQNSLFLPLRNHTF